MQSNNVEELYSSIKEELEVLKAVKQQDIKAPKNAKEFLDKVEEIFYMVVQLGNNGANEEGNEDEEEPNETRDLQKQYVQDLSTLLIDMYNSASGMSETEVNMKTDILKSGVFTNKNYKNKFLGTVANRASDIVRCMQVVGKILNGEEPLKEDVNSLPVIVKNPLVLRVVSTDELIEYLGWIEDKKSSSNFFKSLQKSSSISKDQVKQLVYQVVTQRDLTGISLATLSKSDVIKVIEDVMNNKNPAEAINVVTYNFGLLNNDGKKRVISYLKDVNINDKDELANLMSFVYAGNMEQPAIDEILVAQVEKLLSKANTFKDVLDPLYNDIFNGDLGQYTTANESIKKQIEKVVADRVKAIAEDVCQPVVDVDNDVEDLQGKLRQLLQDIEDFDDIRKKLNEENKANDVLTKDAVGVFKQRLEKVAQDHHLGAAKGINVKFQPDAIASTIQNMLNASETKEVQQVIYKPQADALKAIVEQAEIFLPPEYLDKVYEDLEQCNGKQILDNVEKFIRNNFDKASKQAIEVGKILGTNIVMSTKDADYTMLTQSSQDALQQINQQILRIKQNQDLMEVLGDTLKIMPDNMQDLSAQDLLDVQNRLNLLLRHVNDKFNVQLSALREMIEDLPDVQQLKDFSPSSLTTFHNELERVRKAIKDENTKKLSNLVKLEGEEDNGKAEFFATECENNEAFAKAFDTTKGALGKAVKLDLKGIQNVMNALKETPLLAQHFNKAKKEDDKNKAIEKQKADEEKQKKADEEKQKKEKEEKQKKKKQEIEKKKAQERKDFEDEKNAKQEYDSKTKELVQFQNNNPEPTVNIFICILTFICAVLPLFFYLYSVSNDKEEYQNNIDKRQKDIKDAKDAYEAKKQDNQRKYPKAPHSENIVRKAYDNKIAKNINKNPNFTTSSLSKQTLKSNQL